MRALYYYDYSVIETCKKNIQGKIPVARQSAGLRPTGPDLLQIKKMRGSRNQNQGFP